MEAGSQGPSARLVTASCRILSQQDALLPSSPSSCRTAGALSLQQVAGDSPGSLPGCGEWIRQLPQTLQGKAGENGQPGCCLCKSGIQETVGYAGGKLPAGVANDWVTRRSPSSVQRRFKGEHSVFLPRPLWRPLRGPHCTYGIVAQCTVWPAGPRE